MIRRASVIAALMLMWGMPRSSQAQTATYHLHNEASLVHGGVKQLKTAPPEVAAVAIQSQNFKGAIAGPTDTSIAQFETQVLDPNLGGVIPAQSVVTFSLWMRKTAQYGTFRPRATLFLNNYCCSDGVFVCHTSGYGDPQQPPDLTQTLTAPYILQCTTSQDIVVSPSDRFFVEVDVYVVATPGNHNIFCELDIEGVSGAHYDSTAAVPLPRPPTITSVTPNRGPHNTAVHITGTNFGSTGTVKFNSTSAATSSWGPTAIDTSVPLTATGGTLAATVTVTANGATSTAASFTVTPAPTITALTPSGAAVGQSVTIGGTYFLASQTDGASTVTLNGSAVTPTSWSDTSLGFTVPQGAQSGSVIVTVSGNASNAAAFTLITTGILTGTVTRTTGGTPISGATIQAVLTGAVAATATSATNGTYSISGMTPGTYDVRVSATGFSPEVRSGTSVSANVTTTVNVGMLQPGSISGAVTKTTGGTAIAGAAVALYLGPVQKASMRTDASGNYAVANLHPGAYTAQAADVGFRTKEQGATIPENANTTSNFSLDTAVAGPVTYVYDELNRLVSVIDPSGDAANYAYDAVGNLLSIARAGTTTVSISEFTPRSGPIGSTVTIDGTGFSTTPASNTVTFHGTAGTVTGATATQLTVTVPAGATTGTIGVSTPVGSATSGFPFTVSAATVGAPTITGFSPAIWDGTSALTLTGTNFDATPANDRVNINVAFASPSVASASSLTIPVPSGATSGHISVATVAGTATSANDFFVPPPGYASTNVQSTGRMTIGSAQTVALPVAGRFAMLLFDGSPGHRVSANFTNVTLSSGSAALYDPYGRQVGSTGLVWPSVPFIDTVAESAGTYTLIVAAGTSATGNATVTLYDVQDVTGTIVPDGTSTSVSTTVPGQNDLLTFSTSATQRLSLVVGGNGLGGTVFIGDVRGQPISSTAIGVFSAFIEPVTLPAGHYTVGVDFSGPSTGSQALNLYTVPDDPTGTIAPGGSPVTAGLNTPGQNALYTLGTPVNSRVGLQISAGPIGTVTVLNGTTTVTSSSITVISLFIEPWIFASGQTIKVDPSGGDSGNVTLTASDVPPDTTGTVTVGGAAVPVTLTAGGQNGTLTFAGTATQQVTVHGTGNTIDLVGVSLIDVDGQTVLASRSSIFANFDLSTVTLLNTGTYTIKIDPNGAATGTLNISVSNP